MDGSHALLLFITQIYPAGKGVAHPIGSRGTGRCGGIVDIIFRFAETEFFFFNVVNQSGGSLGFIFINRVTQGCVALSVNHTCDIKLFQIIC